jgi:hypothetical protein
MGTTKVMVVPALGRPSPSKVNATGLSVTPPGAVSDAKPPLTG